MSETDVARLNAQIGDHYIRLSVKHREKNTSYGGSAFRPGFFGESAELMCKARISDKLHRLEVLKSSGQNEAVGESANDTIDDLIGYLVIMRILNGGKS